MPSAFIAASLAANLAANDEAASRLRRQYATSSSVKTRLTNRSPYRSMAAAIREISVASMPMPMMSMSGDRT